MPSGRGCNPSITLTPAPPPAPGVQMMFLVARAVNNLSQVPWQVQLESRLTVPGAMAAQVLLPRRLLALTMAGRCGAAVLGQLLHSCGAGARVCRPTPPSLIAVQAASGRARDERCGCDWANSWRRRRQGWRRLGQGGAGAADERGFC